jgi:hypothetical protein
MARFSAGVRTGAGSTTLPIISLYGGATGGGKVREIGVFNTTTTAVVLSLMRLTNTGTQGAGLTEAKHELGSGPALCTAFTTHSVDPTSGGIDLGYRAILGAAAGAGIIWTFGDAGIVIPADTTEGVAVIVATGTGQVCDAYIVWDE